MDKDRNMSVRLNLRAAFTDLSTALYYIENAYNITDDEVLASALLLMHSDVSNKSSVILGMIEDLDG